MFLPDTVRHFNPFFYRMQDQKSDFPKKFFPAKHNILYVYIITNTVYGGMTTAETQYPPRQTGNHKTLFQGHTIDAAKQQYIVVDRQKTIEEDQYDTEGHDQASARM